MINHGTINRKIRKIVQKELLCSAHDLRHVYRVYNNCIYLSKFEKYVDIDVLKVAALLHDIARVKEDQDNTGNTDHAVLGAEMAKKILKRIKYNKIDEVLHCIKSHRCKGMYKPKSLEAKILYDADKLDTLGAVGIVRLYMIAGQYGQAIHSDANLKRYIKDNFVDGTVNGRIINVAKHAPNLEYESKLKNLQKILYTAKAKEQAKKRVIFMNEFFSRLNKEIKLH